MTITLARYSLGTYLKKNHIYYKRCLPQYGQHVTPLKCLALAMHQILFEGVDLIFWILMMWSRLFSRRVPHLR